MLTPSLNGAPPLSLRATSLLESFEARCDEGAPWLEFQHGDGATSARGPTCQEAAQAWSHGFLRAGVQCGERVGIWQPNSVDFVTSFFGAFGAGAIPVPLPWPVLESAGALGPLEPILRRAGIRCLSAPRTVWTPGFTWAEPKTGTRTWPQRPRLDDTAFLQFTSGSTGNPRGAVISHRAALHNASALIAGLRLSRHDVGVSWVPFFHDMGLVGVMLTSLVGGFPIHVLRPGDFLLRPWRWLSLVGQTRATLTVSPDFGYAMATRRCGDRPFSLASLRVALSGSEPIHFATLEGFAARFKEFGFDEGAFVAAYGLAENTLGVTTGSPWGAPFDNGRGRSLPSVGRPLPGTEVALHGPMGEICVRSPSLASGYFEDAENTARTFGDGWLHTGDLGAVSQGQLCVTGREKDLVIKAGSKFHAGDIEDVVTAQLSAPPQSVAAFNDVDELVLVVEQKEPRGQQDVLRVRAAIVERLGVRVDRVTWVPLGSLPRTTSGKIRRSACAAQFGAQR